MRIHPFRFGNGNALSGALVFIDGMVSDTILTEAILCPLKSWRTEDGPLPPEDGMTDILAQEVLCASFVKGSASVSELAAGLR